MKAKEYYGMYHLSIKDHAPAAIQMQMLHAFWAEFQEICKQRKAVTITARSGVVRELNDKWNAVAALFEAKDGKAILEKNAFLNKWTKGSSDDNRHIQSTATRLPARGTRRRPQQTIPTWTPTINPSHPDFLTTMALLGSMMR